ncbi:hypothetical protein Ancab_018631 [Ancistrocladus abbreviatus]
MDSLSRIPCSPEGIYNAQSEKELHRSGDMHATSKRPSREKAESKEKDEVPRSIGEQDFQMVDVHSGETPLRFLFQKLKKSKKKGIKQKLLSAQQIAREGLDFRGKSVGSILAGPTLAGPPNSIEDNVPTQRALAQISPRVSA